MNNVIAGRYTRRKIQGGFAAGSAKQSQGMVLLLVLVFSQLCLAGVSPRSQLLFRRLTGVPLLATDTRAKGFDDLVQAGKLKEAAAIATADKNFLAVTVRDWAAPFSNRDESPVVELDDLQALFIGVVRDNLDARLLLTGTFRYEGAPNLGLTAVGTNNNKHYIELAAGRVDYNTSLVKKEPQWPVEMGSSGALTTRSWATAHFDAGTNRRPTEYAIKEFLCTPKEKWKDAGLPDMRVRQDVDRKPEGDPNMYLMECRSCHAGLDGLSGAFASYDYVNGNLSYYGSMRVAPKMYQNGDVYPRGYRTTDDSWVNLLTQHHNESFGWRGALDGMGLNEFGKMLSNSKAFSECMVQRVFKTVCRRTMTMEEKQSHLSKMASQFEADGYKLKNLFEEVATQPLCLGEI